MVVKNRRFENKGPCLGMRHMQTLLIFLNIAVIYMSRINVGIALVSITNSETTNPDFPEYDWSNKEVSYVISSFYWGYVCIQWAGGAVSKQFGTTLIMGIATFTSAILSALTPLSIGWGGWKAFCGIRIVQGLSQGMIFPCINQHLANWSPVKERTRLAALSFTGFDCGTVLSLFLSGIIAAGPFGWPGIYYVSAILCFSWCILWWIFAADNTTKSKFITETEKQFIESSLEHSEDFYEKKIPIPWKAIFTSAPFMVFCVVRCSDTWGYSTMQAYIPSYLNGVLEMDITNNGIFSSLPFFVMWGVSFVYILVADIILLKDILSLTALRKIFNSIAEWVPVITLISVGFLEKDQSTLALVLLTINMGVGGGANIGCAMNAIDLSPNHAGILASFASTLANCMSLVTPLIVGVIVTDSHDRTQWQIVFIISAVILFLGNLTYIIWGSAKTQPWDAEDYLVSKDSNKIHNSANHINNDLLSSP